jgi:hypothetical protein
LSVILYEVCLCPVPSSHLASGRKHLLYKETKVGNFSPTLECTGGRVSVHTGFL